MTQSLSTSPPQSLGLASLRQTIADDKHADEHRFVSALLTTPVLSEVARHQIQESAESLVRICRQDTRSQTLLDAFLQEYGLSNKEGVALMCLAEALLRVPDALTANRLIAEKITSGDWLDHTGNSDSWLVNASTWGMVLTGKIVELDPQIRQQPKQWFGKLVDKLSAPLVRLAVLQAMKLMGGQYVLGRTIEEGIKLGSQQAHQKQSKNNSLEPRFSFDMLGEGARTYADAERYFTAYRDSLERVGELNTSNDVYQANGISVKLSALHPQYHFAHYQTVVAELLPKISALCLQAKHHNIGLSIDAEEAARLDMSLDIFEALSQDPELAGWDGLGFVLQAYQKRAPAVARWLVELAKKSKRHIMVRLVKGAYWDSEIKLAQEQGFIDYPVFTRKVNTDVCYLHCADILLKNVDHVYPQFATHNAQTAVAVSKLATELNAEQFEFQRLHGMGELLYKHLPAATNKATPLRVYAPIGQHRDLLPYLVRRLLENGANSSFVNRFLDNDFSAAELVQDNYTEADQFNELRHSKIPVPRNIFNTDSDRRDNARGWDLDDGETVRKLQVAIEHVAQSTLVGHSIIGGEAIKTDPEDVGNPSDSSAPTGIAHVLKGESLTTHLDNALQQAHQAQTNWNELGAAARADILVRVASLLEDNADELIGIINREAGRTIDDCVSEVREAVDFCRYYAEQAKLQKSRSAQGVFLCISPWNFPLAIFTGQVSAALAAGNCVLAKPADPTPIIATKVTQLFHAAGCPAEVLQLVIGDGPQIGQQIMTDPRLSGVAFTGSTEVAQIINRQLAEREGSSIPFIAETGGQNCMLVDSTALSEQVVDDVISSAFHSAGQRCSALRVLYLQDVIADKVLDMLEGALAAVNVGQPSQLCNDVGPVIDQAARQKLQAHVDFIEPLARRSMQATVEASANKQGTYFAPRVFEIDSIRHLKREVFGPVLHVIRYKMSQLDAVIDEINSTGYELTFGVHSRVNAFADYVFDRTNAGNTYINRNTIGAVVGVNPFGGRELSGTGPKAGGPNYLMRYQQPSLEGNTVNPADINAFVSTISTRVMPGPTGELNELSTRPVGDVLLVLNEQTPLKELVALCTLTLGLGNTLTMMVRNIANKAQCDAILSSLPTELHSKITVNEENLLARTSNAKHQVVAVHSSHPQLVEFRRRSATRIGAIAPILEFNKSILLDTNLAWYASYLYSERTKTENLVAKGGNTQLFNLDEEPN